jgi:hypothetical protein
MATTTPTADKDPRRIQLTPTVMVGLLAVLAPLSYIIGRVSTGLIANTYLAYLTSGIASSALGVMIGIPIGLFFGSLRTPRAHKSASVSTPQMEESILEKLRAELVENKSLFEARRGSTTMFARIAYITSFWTTIKASGRLFVMSDADLLSTIATAYYWLDQASRLELLAYKAKYARAAIEGDDASASHLISEVRLLDGQIAGSLENAILAIDNARLALPSA